MIEVVAEVDPLELSRAGLKDFVLAAEAAQVRLDALRMAGLALFDAQEVYADDGATSSAAWLRYQCGTAGGAAREQVKVARGLRSMPATAAAFEAGELSYGKVRLLAFARTDRTETEFDRDESMLVTEAVSLDCDRVALMTRQWKAYADADGVSADTAAQWTRRRAAIVQGYDGTWSLHGNLDAESGAIVAGAWQSITDEFRRADAAEACAAGASTGDSATGMAGATGDGSDAAAGDTAARDVGAGVGGTVVPARTATQRSADALVELARRAGARDPGTVRPSRPELVVMLDYETLVAESGGHGELVDGTILSGDAVRRMACDASIRRVVTSGESEILDLGRSTPTPNGAQRRALELRDGGCIWPGCDRPPTWCDAHHLVPYKRGSDDGGPTDLDGLGLICRRHHHLVHDEHFSITRHPETRVITVTRPDGTIASTTAATGPVIRRRAINHKKRSSVRRTFRPSPVLTLQLDRLRERLVMRCGDSPVDPP